ncbi:Hint domain-containing protein [Paracoccus sp. KR1-242]|uniref:Hint domain-containing protein n=1 Tax=Paracoccus sp. KR1-242 TaxID=3410028 RepID=UPI003BFCC253
MPERILDGSFASALENWISTGTGNQVQLDAATGNAVIFNGGGSAGGATLSQTVAVTPNQTATFSVDFGKLGLGGAVARLQVRIFYLDNGNQVELLNQTATDATGPTYANRSPAALDQSITGTFTIPDGVTEVVVEVIDGTTNTTNNDLVVDNVSLDVLCFCGGTLIETPTGPLPVEGLKAGDLVVTAQGSAPIRWVGRSRVAATGKLAPVRIAAGALGNGLPRRALLVSRQHRILVRSAIVQSMFDLGEALVPANKLVGLPGITVEEGLPEVEYFHLLCDRHEILYAEGAAAESLYLGPQARRSLSPEAVEELTAIFPELMDGQPGHAPACFLPDPRDSKRLVAGHAVQACALQ